MTGRSSQLTPSTAAGLALLALAVVLIVVVQELWRRWPASETRPVAVCVQPIEVISARGGRLGCAEEAAWRDCSLVAGDRVAEGGGCRREPGGMAAALRLLVGMPLELNRASVADLELLDGIGPKLAAAIVADRAERGRFDSLEALERVSGIGPRTVERLRPWLAVESPE